jgi:hypothetical protein
MRETEWIRSSFTIAVFLRLTLGELELVFFSPFEKGLQHGDPEDDPPLFGVSRCLCDTGPQHRRLQTCDAVHSWTETSSLIAIQRYLYDSRFLTIGLFPTGAAQCVDST